MTYFLLFLLGIMVIPVILVIVAIFHPFEVKLKFGDKTGYTISLGYEVPVEYAYIMYHFWNGAEYWQRRNAMEIADLGVEE